MGTAFLYGNGGSGGTGATLTVTAPAGCTVTVSKDGKSKTKVAGADGVAVFKGLETGEWTITITDGEQTAQKTATVTADYAAEITFFAATINVTYPAGSACTATDGTTTLTAPDTSGTWKCGLPNLGTWTVSVDIGFTEKVDVDATGETYTLNKWHIYNRGNQCVAVTGGWKTVKNIGSSKLSLDGGNMVLNAATSSQAVIHVACTSFNGALIAKFKKIAFAITNNVPISESSGNDIAVYLRIREKADAESTIISEWGSSTAKTGEFTAEIVNASSGQPVIAAYRTKMTVSEIWLEA